MLSLRRCFRYCKGSMFVCGQLWFQCRIQIQCFERIIKGVQRAQKQLVGREHCKCVCVHWPVLVKVLRHWYLHVVMNQKNDEWYGCKPRGGKWCASINRKQRS